MKSSKKSFDLVAQTFDLVSHPGLDWFQIYDGSTISATTGLFVVKRHGLVRATSGFWTYDG